MTLFIIVLELGFMIDVLKFWTLVVYQNSLETNSADTYQTASEESESW